MNLKYWEFEDAPMKERIKNVNIRDIAKIYYDNETEAYRFARLLYETKKRGSMRLSEAKEIFPIATAKRYLDFAVQAGLLKHEGSVYTITDRFSKPLKNLSIYIKTWMESNTEEDMETLFPSARKENQQKRGGKQSNK
ncbi:MAG: hypothetical protein QXN59_01620 [Candidatus Micrarchaeaceae archaeon]